MTSVELLDKKTQLKLRAESLIKNAELETRELNEEESSEWDSIMNQISEIEKELEQIKEKLNKETNSRAMKNFSLLKAINDVANNRQMDERSQEMVNAGIAEMRKAGLSYSGQIVLPIEEREIQATVATNGQEVVAEDKLNILEPLRANLVLVEAGANYMTGLVGNVSIPVYNGSNVGWAGEIDAAANGGGSFSEVVLEPKRITAYIDVSKQFLLQDSASAEALIRADIVRAISNKLEETILGNATGNAKQPAGLLYGATALKDTTYKTIVGLMQTLEEKNVSGDIKYIVSPSAKATLKTATKDAGSGAFIMQDGEIDGVPALTTSACKGIVLGNFADYVIGQWGAIDLTVDPYSQATNGKVRLVVNAYFDAKPRRADAFVAKTLPTAA
jgi:HK97 family phage major capsid protein